MSLKVGDWVTSYSSGIWQIYKILQYNDLDPIKKSIKSTTNIFSKRFVNNSFKKSFSEECCHPQLVKELNKEMMRKLNDFIKNNESVFEKFNSYSPKEIDAIYNARISIPEGKTIEDIKKQISTNNIFKITEIDAYLKSLGFNTEKLPSWTVQFKSKNFECHKNWLVYKYHNVLDF